jgi:DNA-binding response OmpR family regulator
MASPALERIRIVVIARPFVGRRLVDQLATAGYEVYRTPSAIDTSALCGRVRPQLAIVAIDQLTDNGITTALELRAAAIRVPVLLLGDAGDDPRAAELPILPSSSDSQTLLNAIERLLIAS